MGMTQQDMISEDYLFAQTAYSSTGPSNKQLKMVTNK